MNPKKNIAVSERASSSNNNNNNNSGGDVSAANSAIPPLFALPFKPSLIAGNLTGGVGVSLSR